jgi:hypothetical protein
MRCGHLTYDTWLWLKITSLSSKASVLNDGRISLEISSFCSEFFFSKRKFDKTNFISLKRTPPKSPHNVVLKTSVASMTSQT